MRRIVAECDWCLAEFSDLFKAEYRHNYDHNDLCPACVLALKVAVEGVRNSRCATSAKPDGNK